MTPASRTISFLAMITVAGLPTVMSAQTVGNGDCGFETGSTIRGVVVNDSTGAPVPQSHLYMDVADPAHSPCRARTDVLGRFSIHRVPPGTHRLRASMGGYRTFMPVDVVVRHGDTSYIELRLVPGGPLEDCRAEASCSLLLERGSVQADSADADFRLVALGTAIGLAWRTITNRSRWYACLQNELQAHVEAIRDRYGPVAEADSCEIRADPSSVYGPRMLHIGTTRPAFQPIIENVIVLSRTRRTVSLGYFYGPHGGEGWDCDFMQTEQGWRATLCIESWES